MWKCYIEFKVNDDTRFRQLQRFVKDFQRDRDEEIRETVDDSKWLDYFDEKMLQQFWWPTEKDWEEYTRIWESLTFEERQNDPRLQHPWEFTSWLDCIYTGEHKLLSCEKTSPNLARLEYLTLSWPYGSVDALRHIVQIFGFEIVREEV
ncbi:hypothetical protein [Polycladomyces subterraneus]|uniref:Uncharacterized protein n=1 Tax=Polycladomyces subterraneus TaxID=1016997 RepID=A0ABT8IR40_9BACL|nr:hypothetical protein [Polycladomyces subterraneus]MDN4595210.1 hypothetical protein [Polycladomyces subterraneus]